MKKILLAALAAFTLFSATTASAARLIREPLKWRHSGTTFDRLQISSTFGDTTQYFGMDTWAVPFSGSSDTLNLGAVIVSVDSSTTYTANLTKFIVKILAYSNDGVNPTAVVTQTSATLTSGDKMFSIPLFVSMATGFRLLQRGPFPMGADKIRVLVLGETGSMNAAKVELVRFAE